ncbi:hypothetical protein AB0L82_04295 [Nocardia sp. NPDC052001]
MRGFRRKKKTERTGVEAEVADVAAEGVVYLLFGGLRRIAVAIAHALS